MTDTTNKADSLLCSIDVLQQQQHLVTGGESSSGSNSSADTPVSFGTSFRSWMMSAGVKAIPGRREGEMAMNLT